MSARDKRHPAHKLTELAEQVSAEYLRVSTELMRRITVTQAEVDALTSLAESVQAKAVPPATGEDEATELEAQADLVQARLDGLSEAWAILMDEGS